MLQGFTDLEVRVREFGRRARRDEGAGMVEYALLVSLIGVFLIVALGLLADDIAALFGEAGDAL